MARRGVCSRRDAEKIIFEGRVCLDGNKVVTPATIVFQNSTISIDGKNIPPKEKCRVWCYHKTVGTVTTHSDPFRRRTVFDEISAFDLPRVISVGRLDLNSEGLLLLTNDGNFARHAELPSTAWPRSYKVRTFGEINPTDLTDLARGITVDGFEYGPIKANLAREQNTMRGNQWLDVTLYEGKNREIRRVMEHLGLQVNRLIRVGYGPYTLGNLPPNGIREVVPQLNLPTATFPNTPESDQ